MFQFSFVRVLLILASSSVTVRASHPCTLPPDRLASQILSLGSLSRGRLVLLTRSLDLFETVFNSRGLLLSPRSSSLNGTLGVNPSYRRYWGVFSNSIVTYMNGSGVILFVAATAAADEGESQPKSGHFERLFLYNDTSATMTRHAWTFEMSLEGVDGLVCVWLSSAPPFMFLLLKDRYDGWLLVRVRISPQGRLKMAGPLLRLCLYARNDQLYGVGLSEERCPLQTNATNLSITGGLHHDGTFYLFSGSHLFKFSDKPYEDFEKASPETRAQPMPITKQVISDWLGCVHKKNGTQLMSTTAANSVSSDGTESTVSRYSQRTLVLGIVSLVFLLLALIIMLNVVFCIFMCEHKKSNPPVQKEEPEEPEEPEDDSLEEVQVQLEQATGDLKEVTEPDEEAVMVTPVTAKSQFKLKASKSLSSLPGAVGGLSPRSISLYRPIVSLESKRSSPSKEKVKSSPTWTEKCLLLPTSPFLEHHASLVKQKASNYKSSSMALTTISPPPKPKSVNLDL